jgi:hypothetical protein
MPRAIGWHPLVVFFLIIGTVGRKQPIQVQDGDGRASEPKQHMEGMQSFFFRVRDTNGIDDQL